MHTSKIILQAIGRICRTNKKNKNIFISFDCQMEFDLAYCKNELLKRPLNYEFKELLNKCENVKEEVDNSIFKINNSKIKKNSDKINALLQFKSNADISKWEELRDIVLRHPYDNVGIHNEYDIYCELTEPSTHYYYNKDQNGEYNITYEKVNECCISEDLANLKTLMSIKEIKTYFENMGYATNFEKSYYILLPNVFTRIYLGALGESVGEFLINRFLNQYGLKLAWIKDTKRYEKYDYFFGNDKYVDFKYWNGNFDKDRQKEVEKCIRKLNECNGKRGFIINILKPNNYDPKQYVSSDDRLTIIPYLYDPATRKWNLGAFDNLLK